MNPLLWHLLAGTRGGQMRSRILMALKTRPSNAHQLAKQLAVDYTTVQHHLEILLEHMIVQKFGTYGATYSLTDTTLSAWKDFGEIWDGLRKTHLKNGR